MAAEEEVKAAFKAVWDVDDDMAGVFGPLKEGKLPSPQPDQYATVAAEPGPTSNCHYARVTTGKPYQCYIKATLTVWCRKEQVSAAADAMKEFDWLPRDGRRLTFPSPTLFVSCRPLGEPTSREDPAPKKGTEVWMVTHEMEVWTTRYV